jgi:hypothetical protein
MIAETAELVAEMNLRGDFPRQASRFQTSLKRLNVDTVKLRRDLGRVGDGIKKGFKAAAVIGAGAVGLLAVNIRAGVESLMELEDVQNQTNAVIKSTRGVAGLTAEAVRELAEGYEDLTTIDDKVVQSGANVLLTFTNIRRQAFEPALEAALDLSVAMDQDLKSSVVQVGKALNDPIRGMSALTRVGIQFSEQQRRVIERLVKTGDTMGAQKVILKELNRQFGGSATAAAQGYRGQMNRLNDAVEDLQQSLAGPLIRPLTQVSRKLAAFAKSRDVQQGIRGIGKAFASLFEDKFVPGEDQGSVKRIASPFTKGLGFIKEAFEGIQSLPWPEIKGHFTFVAGVASRALELFRGLPPEVQAGLVTLLAANQLTGGALASLGKTAVDLALKAVTTIMAGNVTVMGKTVTTTGNGGGVGTTGKGGKGGFTGLFGGGLAGLLGGLALGSFGSQPDVVDVTDPKAQAYIKNLNADQQRRLAELNRRMAGQTEKLNIANRIGEQVRGAVQTIREKAAQGVGMDGRQNDLLRDIAADAQAEVNTSRTSQRAQSAAARVAAQQRTMQERAARLTAAKTALVQNAVLRTIPVIGTVRSAANATAQAIRQKDLSVRVGVNLSTVTVAQGVTRATTSNRFIIS